MKSQYSLICFLYAEFSGKYWTGMQATRRQRIAIVNNKNQWLPSTKLTNGRCYIKQNKKNYSQLG
jgi:hypothetical protein